MSDPKTILVVEDDSEISRILRQGLEAEGYRVLEARNKGDLLRAVAKQQIDLVTLDLGLGHDDGLELARELRKIRNLPIIMISGRGEPIDRVTGLEYGADDYIAKPFFMREVTIRIRNVLAHYEPADPRNVQTLAHRLLFDGYVLDTQSRELRSADGTLVELTETEFNLLEIFMVNAARVMSRDEIWRLLRGRDWSPLDRTLDSHIARLRRKIESPDAEEPRTIKSVRGVGYVFTAAITWDS